MVLPGNCVIIHDKPSNRTSWGHHVTPGWYIGSSLDHYKCMQCYMPTTGILLITDTIKYIPKVFYFQKTTTEDYLQQTIGDIIEIIQDPPKTLTFLSCKYETENEINNINHILQQSTTQPHLKILLLNPMLLQIHNQDP